MFLCDFHIHSHYSDGKLSIPQIVDMYGKEGFGAIAVTDHICDDKSFLGRSAHLLKKTLHKYNFSEYLLEIKRESQRALKQYNMKLIAGVEFTKNSFSHNDSAHILALGINSYINPNYPLEVILNQIRKQNAISIAAHPVATRKVEPQTFYLWKHRDRLNSLFDAWEVASGTHLFDEVYESGLPMVASSDLHRPQQFSSWKTRMSGDRSINSILKNITHQELDFTFFENKTPLKELLSSRNLSVPTGLNSI